mgnify:CR=1 FL=1
MEDFTIDKFSRILKELDYDALILGESIVHVGQEGVRRIDPLSDEATEIKHDCKIEYLTKEEIVERYGK